MKAHNYRRGTRRHNHRRRQDILNTIFHDLKNMRIRQGINDSVDPNPTRDPFERKIYQTQQSVSKRTSKPKKIRKHL